MSKYHWDDQISESNYGVLRGPGHLLRRQPRHLQMPPTGVPPPPKKSFSWSRTSVDATTEELTPSSCRGMAKYIVAECLKMSQDASKLFSMSHLLMLCNLVRIAHLCPSKNQPPPTMDFSTYQIDARMASRSAKQKDTACYIGGSWQRTVTPFGLLHASWVSKSPHELSRLSNMMA